MPDDVALVRLADPSGLDAVLAVDAESFSHPWTRQMYEDDLGNAHAQIWLAKVGGMTVGYCAVWQIVDELHINNVAVRRDWRGRGIGTRLVRHALSLARADGLVAALLEVRGTNLTARRLYERLGFEVCGLRKGYYANPPDDAVIMRAEIQALGGGSAA